MSEYVIPLSRVMLLQAVLDAGGTTTCPLRHPESTVDALITVETDASTHQVKVKFGPLTGSVTLERDNSAKYRDLRDFIQDVANGRTESGSLSQQAIALMEALDCVNDVIADDQTAYITPTLNPNRPFGAVVTNALGEICAAATGTCKDHLASLLRSKLNASPEGAGERV